MQGSKLGGLRKNFTAGRGLDWKRIIIDLIRKSNYIDKKRSVQTDKTRKFKNRKKT